MLSLKYLIISIADVYSMVLFVYVMMSWLPTDRGILADINNVLAKLCDPYLNLFRKLIPPLGGIVDVTSHHCPACITIRSTFTDWLVLTRTIVPACSVRTG